MSFCHNCNDSPQKLQFALDVIGYCSVRNMERNHYLPLIEYILVISSMKDCIKLV